MEFQLILVIVFAAIGYLALAYCLKWLPFREKSYSGQSLLTSNLIQFSRPDGGLLFSTREIAPDILTAMVARIEIGLARQIRWSSHYNLSWRLYDKTSDYQIAFIDKHTTNVDNTPALIVSGIQTAGTVVNVFADGVERGEPIIILPLNDDWSSHWSTYLNYLENSVQHEAEHVREWKCDKKMFKDKAVAADIHPHWPALQDVARGLLANPAAQQSPWGPCLHVFPDQDTEIKVFARR